MVGIPMSLRIFQFVVIHTVKGFSIVNKAEVDVFLEFPCFFYDSSPHRFLLKRKFLTLFPSLALPLVILYSTSKTFLRVSNLSLSNGSFSSSIDVDVFYIKYAQFSKDLFSVN